MPLSELSNVIPSRFLFANGVVAVGKKEFRCHSVKSSYVVNQIPVSEIIIVADYATVNQPKPKYPTAMADIYTALKTTKKGDYVSVSFDLSINMTPAAKVELRNATTTMFNGVLLGWAPVWFSPKVMRMTLWAIHPLGMLDWSSSIIDPIQGSGFDDHKLPAVAGEKEELVPYMRGGYSDSNVQKDLWKQVIKKELIRICKATRFDSVNSEQVASYLEDSKLDGSEVPLSWQLSNPMAVLLDVRKTLLTTAPGRRTLWDNLVSLSNTYKFSIIGRTQDYSIAPVLPAIGGDDPKYTLLWQEYFRRGEFNALARGITQSIGLLRGLGGATDFFDLTARRLQKEFRNLESEPVTAGTDYFMVPRFMDFTYEPFLNTSRTTGLKPGGLVFGSTALLRSAGYCLTNKAESEDTLNTQYNNIPEDDLKNYANVLMNERAYDGIKAVLQGLVDFNLCPGSAVLVDPPLADNDKDVYYAHVWGVTIVLDGGGTSSGTYLVLSHIRTKEEQDAIELTKHPLYDKRWVSAPIQVIKVNGQQYTMEPDYA